MLFSVSYLIVTSTLAAPLAYPRFPSSCNGKIFIVQNGETISNLMNAVVPGTSMTLVAQANPQIQNLDSVFPGDQICVPTPGSIKYPQRKVASCSGLIVPVNSGDTAFKLMQSYAPGTSLSAIQSANPQIQDINKIYPGDQLCIPHSSQTPCPGTLYTIRNSDSIFNLINIGKFQGTSLNAMKAANPSIPNLGTLTPGQQVCFPRS